MVVIQTALYNHSEIRAGGTVKTTKEAGIYLPNFRKGQHYRVVPRIPRASSSTIIPKSVKVNMPSWRRKKNKMLFEHKKQLVSVRRDRQEGHPIKSRGFTY